MQYHVYFIILLVFAMLLQIFIYSFNVYKRARLRISTSNIEVEEKSYVPMISRYVEVIESQAKEIAKIEATAQEQYVTLLAIIPNTVYTIDSNGLFLEVRNAELIGWSDEELKFQHFSMILTPECYQNVARDLVLPRYRGKITGEINQPGLFDERRSYPRITRKLPIELLRKDKSKLNAVVTTCGLVHSVGLWAGNPRTENKLFVGTLGIIEVK